MLKGPPQTYSLVCRSLAGAYCFINGFHSHPFCFARKVMFVMIALAVPSCVIEEDLGSSGPQNRGTSIANLSSVSKVFWYNENEILVHDLGLKTVNVNTKEIVNVTGEYIYEIAGVTDNDRAIVIIYNQIDYRPQLWSITLPTNDWTLISPYLRHDYYTNRVIVRGNKVAFLEVNDPEIDYVSWFVFNTENNSKKYLFDGYEVQAFSPDGNKLLYRNFGNYFTYDLTNEKHEPSSLPGNYWWRIFWNNDGITAYEHPSSGDRGVALHGYKQSNASTFVIDDISSAQGIYLSSDGGYVAHLGGRCANSHYVYDCYGGGRLVTLNVVSISTLETRLEAAAVTVPNPELAFDYIRTADFSPDKSRVVYNVLNTIYVQDVLQSP